VLDAEMKKIKNELRAEVFESKNWSKAGRSGDAVGAQVDKSLGNRMVQEANNIKGRFPELAEALKKEGKRLVNRGNSGAHK